MSRRSALAWRSTLSPVPPGGNDTSVARRWARLEPELASAREARQLLRDALAAVGVGRNAGWTDAAELAVHELVANAVLHAHTPIEVTVDPKRDRVHVEVRDFEPSLPAARHYDAQATTGRGMALVAALTDSCGARSLGSAGKVVWFDIGVDSVAGDGETEWDVQSKTPAQPVAGAEPAVHVRLERMPVTLWLAARQHHDALLRELVLYVAERDLDLVDFALVDRARGTVSRVVAQTAESLEDERPGPWTAQEIDIEVLVPRDLGPAFAALQDALDAGERLAARGEMLARPGLPEIIEVRDWVCHQIAAQLAGVEPSPWEGTAQERFETMAITMHGTMALPPDVLGIRTSTRPVVAADVANRIVAVSQPLADLLGWRVDELVGRRVVTLVPPELREAHVAGFSRYMSTGDARILGRPLELAVLHRDGRRLPCRLLVEQAPGAGGEAMFVAWIDLLAADQPTAPGGGA